MGNRERLIVATQKQWLVISGEWLVKGNSRFLPRQTAALLEMTIVSCGGI
jgi:hypothetical protein